MAMLQPLRVPFSLGPQPEMTFRRPGRHTEPRRSGEELGHVRPGAMGSRHEAMKKPMTDPWCWNIYLHIIWHTYMEYGICSIHIYIYIPIGSMYGIYMLYIIYVWNIYLLIGIILNYFRGQCR